MEEDSQNTAAISREHTINISRSGLLSIAGGKWTTYRKMAEDVLEQAILVGNLEFKSCVTERLQVYGYHEHSDIFGDMKQYGSAAPELELLLDEKPNYRNRLHPEYTHVEGEVVWSVRNEMARGVEDFLARRTRLLFLDVEATLAVVSKVAHLMAQELGCDKDWEKLQVANFNALVNSYRIKKTN